MIRLVEEESNHLIGGFLLSKWIMKTFVLNLTKIVESNPKIYASIIVGLVGCLILLITEAVHIQSVVQALATKDQSLLRDVVRPLTQRYSLSRYVLIIASIVWSVFEYKASKKKLGL